MKKHQMGYIIILFIFVLVCLAPFIPKTNSKYVETKSKKVIINAVQPTYTIVFDANGGNGTMDNQVFTYSVAANLHENTFTHDTKGFVGWNTLADGTGVFYNDQDSIYNLTSENGAVITLYAVWIDKVAKIGNTFYDTLTEAVAVANASGEETEIILLKSTNENINIARNSNVILNLQGNTLGNVGNDNTIKNYGTLIIKNGNVISNAATNGAINNYNTGRITISGVNVRVYGTGNRQAFYNEKGVATINGGSVLTSISNARPAVTNLSGGTMTITDATIISTAYSGLKNEGTLVIGNESDAVNNANPSIKGETYGLETNKNVVFYDGILIGRTQAVDNPNRLTSLPVGYYAIDAEEEIDGTLYYEKYVDRGAIVTFNPEGGYIKTSEETKIVSVDKPVGTLPKTVKNAQVFEGWYTEVEGGEEILSSTIIEEDVTLHAHWINNSCVAKIGDITYDSLQEAIDASSDTEVTSIELLKDTTEILTVSSTKDIELILGEHIISNVGNTAVITNSGSLNLVGGLITSDADTATINNLSGTLNIQDVHLSATGTRQTIYITTGDVTISGNSYLTSKTTGTPTTTTMQRGAIQCLSGGTLNVLGGTIIGENQHAISSEGILTIGVKDGIVGINTPTIIGKVDGVKSTGVINFYDGIIEGKTNAIEGEITDIEENTTIINGNDNDYQTVYLKLEEDNTTSTNFSLSSIDNDLDMNLDSAEDIILDAINTENEDILNSNSVIVEQNNEENSDETHTKEEENDENVFDVQTNMEVFDNEILDNIDNEIIEEDNITELEEKTDNLAVNDVENNA